METFFNLLGNATTTASLNTIRYGTMHPFEYHIVTFNTGPNIVHQQMLKATTSPGLLLQNSQNLVL